MRQHVVQAREAHQPSRRVDDGEAAKALGRVRRRLALSPFESEARLEGGDPSDRILRAADRDGSDLIVIGTRGRSGLERLLIGGVAPRVVRGTPWQVLVVPPP